MNSFINYILESGISLGALSLVYFVFLRRETFFKMNRLFLLFAILFSSVLPLLHLKVYGTGDQLLLATQQGTNMLDAITVNGSELSHSIVSWITTNQLVLASYIAGAFIITLPWHRSDFSGLQNYQKRPACKKKWNQIRLYR